ncbi:YhgE/Pip family protein [Pueribacillus sp. YX66]|uniref:YhgE/Pip family protein n=1 Tax=Pueribacillus sp. YX66 TaxID=3229242 RepID=UPI00358D87D8
MKLNQMKQELLSIITNKKILIPVIAVIFVPVMYSAMFLWAFWDPYARLDQIPVAVVNKDEGEIFQDEKLEIGNEFVNKLKETPEFKWDFVDEETADRGLRNEKYYMKIEIPKDFSKKATTVLDDYPEQLELHYVPNESFNFLAGQIGETAVDKIKEKIANELSETYIEVVFENIGKLADGIELASDGAAQLADGTTDAKTGAELIEANLKKVVDGSNTLQLSLVQAQSGTQTLNTGIQRINDGNQQLLQTLQETAPKVNKLTDGTAQVKNGAHNLNEGLSDLQVSLEERLIPSAQRISNGLNASNKQLEEAKKKKDELATAIRRIDEILEQLNTPEIIEQNPDLAKYVESLIGYSNELKQVAAQFDTLVSAQGQLAEGSETLVAGLQTFGKEFSKAQKGSTQLATGIDQLAAGTETVAQGWDSLIDNVGKLANGSEQLVAGSGQLTDGLSQIQNGSAGLASGTNELYDGSKELTSGLTELNDGADELASKLKDGANEASDVSANEDHFNMFADPVKVKSDTFAPVPNYGTGFAPYFISLGLFVGALLLSIVFPLRDPAVGPKSAFSWFASKFSLLVLIGIAQALIVDAILLFGLKIEVTSVPYFILFTVITSIVFMSLIQFLTTAFGDPGRFIAIILLIMQLTTSAGTFPLELIPEVLQKFNSLLPMTYSVSGFKAVISSGDYGFMLENVGYLSIFLMTTIAATIVYFVVLFKKTYAKWNGREKAV